MMLLDKTPLELRGKAFKTEPGIAPRGRVEIFHRPVPGRSYVAGADFAYGIGRDYDTAVILDKSDQHEGKPARQVAEVQGHWGTNFHTVLYALLMYYNGAFLVGERQVGLFTLRRLWDEYGFRFMYLQRGEDKTAVLHADNASLGIHNGSSDLVMSGMREAVAHRKVRFCSPKLIEQMAACQYVPKKLEEEGQILDSDHRLAFRVMSGGSPDLVWAAAYAVFGLAQVHLFEPPKPMFTKGSYGDIMGYEKTYNPGHKLPSGIEIIQGRQF